MDDIQSHGIGPKQRNEPRDESRIPETPRQGSEIRGIKVMWPPQREDSLLVFGMATPLCTMDAEPRFRQTGWLIEWSMTMNPHFDISAQKPSNRNRNRWGRTKGHQYEALAM